MLAILYLCIRSLFESGRKQATKQEINERLLTRRDKIASRDPSFAKLDPIRSIVDRCKLFYLDHSIEGRRQLWRELGIEGDYSGTAEQNVELLRVFDEHLAKGEIWNAQEV